MQKKLIALALASLAGSAFAQSNVTIYGVMDATFDVVKRSGANDLFTNGTSGVTSASLNNNNYSLNRVSYNSSYLGFKGAEDLGNGLKAVFQLEMQIDPAAAAAISANRDSFAGISSGFGTIVAGNLTGPTRALGNAVDVNSGATGIGANSGLLGKLGNNLTNLTVDGNGMPGVTASARSQTQNSVFDTRFKNAIAYVSPNFSGFSGVAAYVANESKNNGGANGGNVATDNRINTYGYDLGVNYNNGPIMAGITYNAVALKNGAATFVPGATATRPVTYAGVALAGLGSDIKTSDFRVGGAYDFGIVKISGIYDYVKLKSDVVSSLSQKVWGVGASVPIGAGRLLGQYYHANNLKDTSDTGARLWEVGYEYSLSKRTIVKAVYARLDNDNNANYDFGINAVGNGASSGVGSTGNITTVGMGSSVSGIQMGLRHSF